MGMVIIANKNMTGFENKLWIIKQNINVSSIFDQLCTDIATITQAVGLTLKYWGEYNCIISCVLCSHSVMSNPSPPHGL